jgi:diguanylate cyclase (GGDEF)-like protein
MQVSLNYALDESAIACAARTERLRVFNERCIFGAVSGSAGIALLAWIIWASTGWATAFTWAVLVGSVELTIFLAGRRCRRAFTGNGSPELCLNVHTALATLGGITWGSSVWFVWRDGDIQSYLAVLTVLVGVAGVSMVTMAAYAKVTVLFFSGLYLMPLLHITLYGGQEATVVEAGLVIGLAVQLGYTRELGRIVLRDVDQYARNAALVDKLHELVIHDQLTGVYSRRYTFEQLEQLVSTRQRHGTCASVIMFDLDHFKVINDRFGHPTGDRALREVVRVVSAQLRDGDLLGRIGGEEFLVLLPMTDMVAAMTLAERLRRSLAESMVVDGTSRIFLPASFGIAELKSAESHSEWFRRVDGALYQAKEKGRNTLVAAD